MKRARVYLLIVAVGIVGPTAGMLNGAWRDRALHEFDWGNELTLGGSNFAANRVRIVAPFDADKRRFSYCTGGHCPGNGEPSAAPKRVFAQAEHGLVTVRLRAFDPYTSRDSLARTILAGAFGGGRSSRSTRLRANASSLGAAKPP